MKRNHLLLIGYIFLILHVNSFGQVSKLWETDSVFFEPESIVFDSINNCIYVSNFNDKGGFRDKNDTLHNEFISKLDLNGNIIQLKWLDSIFGPTGLAIFNKKIFIVERNGICIADIKTGKIEKKITIDYAGFLNDIAIDKNGTAYISDSRKNCIYKIVDEKSNIWYTDTVLNNCNGLFIDDNYLLIGNRGTENLISVSLTDKTCKIIAKDISFNIDGIKKTKDRYLLSWRTEFYALDLDGNKKLLYTSENKEDFLADFEFIENKKLILIPTLLSNKVIALSISE